MTVALNRNLAGQNRSPYNKVLAPSWIAVSEANPVINGLSFSKHIPARAGCLMRDAYEPNWFRFELAPGDICVGVDGAEAQVERCQLSCPASALSFNTAYTIQYQRKIYTPGTKDAASDGWISLTGLHASPDAQDADVSGAFIGIIYISPRAIAYDQRTSEVNPIVSNVAANYVYIDPNPSASWNRWISVVEQHYISPTTTAGYHRVYHDGVLVANYSGKTGYVDSVGPYCKFGIYRDADATNTVVVEYRDFKVTSP